jgi:hypothetical protein
MGDTILMPTGSFIWGAGDTVTSINTQGVILAGAGSSIGGRSSTIITAAATAPQEFGAGGLFLIRAHNVVLSGFSWQFTVAGTDPFSVNNMGSGWRITDIGYNDNLTTGPNRGSGSGFISGVEYTCVTLGKSGFLNVTSTAVGVGSVFTATGSGIGTDGTACLGVGDSYFLYGTTVTYGVIDNCTIFGGTTPELVFCRGALDGWEVPATMGSKYAVYIENCTFWGSCYVSDFNACARGVVRYCLINGSIKIDGHGACTNDLPSRSVRHIEIYGNQWTATGGNGSWVGMEIRGGTHRIFNNITNNADPSLQCLLELKDYVITIPDECGTFSGVCKTPYDYPIMDQIGVGTDALPWVTGQYYTTGQYAISSGVIFTNYVATSSTIPPYLNTGCWSGHNTPWVSGQYYTPGQYAGVSGTGVYINIVATSGASGMPPNDLLHWIPQGSSRVPASDPTYVFNNFRTGASWQEANTAVAVDDTFATDYNPLGGGTGYPTGSFSMTIQSAFPGSSTFNFATGNYFNLISGNAVTFANDPNAYLVTGIFLQKIYINPGLLVGTNITGSTGFCGPFTCYQYRLQNSYGFNNLYSGYTFSQTDIIKANRDYFWDNDQPFNGASGVGRGTYAQMMAINSPTYNVGFCVLDQGTWNSAPNAVAGVGGAGALSSNPTGFVLYAWKGSGLGWVNIYTPYNYPHPLVVGSPYSSAYAAGQAITIYQV